MFFRLKAIKLGLITLSLIVLARLFYWQVLSSQTLTSLAMSQRASSKLIPSTRGEIFTSDGFPLVTNQPSFTVFAYKPQLTLDSARIALNLAPLLTDYEHLDATESAKPVNLRISETQTRILDSLSTPDKNWVPLKRRIDPEIKAAIESLNLSGIGFDPETTRYYPEASTSAHLIGFVGRDEAGDPRGYFGLEGFYDLELAGKPGLVYEERDATGRPILIGDYNQTPGRPGRNLILHLNRPLQYLVEKHLKVGLVKYQAVSGEVVVMDPHTGAILALASFPNYDPGRFNQFSTAVFKNPVISETYEPGSIFKTLVMAAAVDAGAVTADTRCDATCNGPVHIGEYTVRTWNDQYYPGSTMTEVLAHSDNTGMIFAVRNLGETAFLDYLHKFGIGSPTNIDLQEETSPLVKTKWPEIDLATASFGQGLAVTSIQMVRAVASIANQGILVRPQVVDRVEGDKVMDIKPKIEGQAISKTTAQTLTQMMINAVREGDARWARPKNFTVAGKTGTAQIPIKGHYDEKRTIASFIGFAPAENPRFVMLVKLTEPKSSPWGSETAAPLWFAIANDLLLQL